MRDPRRVRPHGRQEGRRGQGGGEDQDPEPRGDQADREGAGEVARGPVQVERSICHMMHIRVKIIT